MSRRKNVNFEQQLTDFQNLLGTRRKEVEELKGLRAEAEQAYNKALAGQQASEVELLSLKARHADVLLQCASTQMDIGRLQVQLKHLRGIDPDEGTLAARASLDKMTALLATCTAEAAEFEPWRRGMHKERELLEGRAATAKARRERADALIEAADFTGKLGKVQGQSARVARSIAALQRKIASAEGRMLFEEAGSQGTEVPPFQPAQGERKLEFLQHDSHQLRDRLADLKRALARLPVPGNAS